MNKWLNKDVIITSIIGVLATLILVISFRFFITNNQVTDESDQQNPEVTSQTPTSTAPDLEVFKDETLGISFEYPKGLAIVSDGSQPTDQALWLDVASISIEQAKQVDFWKTNLSKLALGELVSLPGDVYNQKTALTASAGEWPVSIYSELDLKNCQPNYNSKMIALIDNRIIILTLHHNSASVAEELKTFLASSTPETLDCQNKIVDAYDADAFVAQIEKGFEGQVVLSGLNIFQTVISSFNITKVKADKTSSSTPAYINQPSADSNGNLVLGIDELVVLTGDEAITKMKDDKVCADDCQVPAEGYVVNNNKKFNNFALAENALVVVKPTSTSTPAQLTRVSLPLLTNYLKQVDPEKPPVFDVYFDEAGKVVTGIKQR